jgi:hypothetical protein
MQMVALPKCLRVKPVSYYKSVSCTIHMGAPPYPLRTLSIHPRLEVAGWAVNSQH